MNCMKNPLTMRGELHRCWLFAYRTPVESVASRVPKPLRLVTCRGWAFWNVVVCRVRALRPAGCPRWLGLDYWHVAYRLLVEVPLASGRVEQGLYFVRSECDHPWVHSLGNLLTDFAFHDAVIHVEEGPEGVRAQIRSQQGRAHFQTRREGMPHLAEGSPFASMEEAALFLKYQPCAYGVLGPSRVQQVRVSRDERLWRQRAVGVESARWPLLKDPRERLELAWEVDPLPYQWNRGRTLEVAP
jgi:hypothetical protein